jgi:hypothetical protein
LPAANSGGGLTQRYGGGGAKPSYSGRPAANGARPWVTAATTA